MGQWGKHDASGGGNGQAAYERVDVKNEVARTLIEAMENGNAPWQKPWHTQALSPTNPITGNGYKGVNRLLLSMAARADEHGRLDSRFMTYKQAEALGYQVRKGERGTPIVKVVTFDRENDGGAGGAGQPRDGKKGQGGERESERKSMSLRRYVVFNAQQIDGVPELEGPTSDQPFKPAERAEAVIEAMKEKTGLLVIHGGDKACYIPSLDEVRLPAKSNRIWRSEYDYFSTAFHEISHSSLHESRLNRTDAIGKKWGDEAYALEELRAEISSAIIANATGVAAQISQDHMKAHIANHAAYLQSWVKAVKKDPMAIFSAAKDADLIAEYVLGIERQHSALAPHKEWIEEYEATPMLARRA
jgi:antirestriction protein ArdC